MNPENNCVVNSDGENCMNLSVRDSLVIHNEIHTDKIHSEFISKIHLCDDGRFCVWPIYHKGPSKRKVFLSTFPEHA